MKTTKKTTKSASLAYAEKATAIYAKLDELHEALLNHCDCMNANWSHVGDVSYVDEKLGEVIAFLTETPIA